MRLALGAALPSSDRLASAIAAVGVLLLGLGVGLITGHAVTVKRATGPRNLAEQSTLGDVLDAFRNLPASRARPPARPDRGVLARAPASGTGW